jgi:dipeptidase E
MKLWLYSSGDLESNKNIDQLLLKQINKRRPSYCFIPAAYDDFEYYYDEFINRFSTHSPCHFNALHLDRQPSEKDITKALKSDLVYLSGGNTFHLLKHIRISGIEGKLRDFLNAGGIIAGHSAGAIVMSPNINTASYPPDDRDENRDGLTNLRGMKFYSFEVFPHFYVRSKSQNEALRHASKDSKHMIYGLPDGAAIAIDGSSLTFHGPVACFAQGIRSIVRT